MKLLLGDCIDKLKELDDNSVDSIVTDPPYGLSFMGKKWDYDVPSQEIFEECLRVLKPGGHLLSFAGSRTYHRMAVRVEDAGFVFRDQIMWIYGSGFPKSMNIGKAVDKKFGNEREVGNLKFKGGTQLGIINDDNWEPKDVYESKGNSEWEGWGTALKPAHEPIVMARKPLSEKTIVDNVLEWGTGGINIDESRIGFSEDDDPRNWHSNRKTTTFENTENIYELGIKNVSSQQNQQGRFPANIIFDEEAGKILDEQSGVSKSKKSSRGVGYTDSEIYGSGDLSFDTVRGHNDVGGASRFFYCPKTSKRDRNEGTDNKHPTVKPTDLMLYLIRLVTPKGGTTLDPFMGSGSTGKAAVRGGFEFVGIEREEEYMEIAEARIQYEMDNPYNEETKSRTEVKSEVKENLNKFFSF